MPPAVPVYQRAIDEIRRRTATGEWPPGFKLPPADELAAQFTSEWGVNVSVGSLRRATDTLQALGVLVGRQGVGVFVADPAPRPPS